MNDYNITEQLEKSYQAIVDAFVNCDHLSTHEFFSKVFESAFELIPYAEKGSFYEKNGDMFIPIFSKGYDMTTLQKLAFNEENLFIGFEVNREGNIEVYEYYNKQRDDSKFSDEDIMTFKELGTYSEFTSLYAPIQVDGTNIGLLCFERFDGKHYDTSSKLILKLYAQLISNFYTQMVHAKRERERYQEIIDAMVSAIELKDKYTEGHGKRVTDLARGLASFMELQDTQVEIIGAAAILHDIGKIGISSDLLNKPGKLTREEYEIIKEHPLFTKKILENIKEFSEVVKIAYMHHEYHNGKGYPQGIKGDDIPIGSAIISVVDAFDAMTTDRSYRKAMSEDQSLSIIQEECGQQFNPQVVEAFIKWRAKIKI